MKTKITTTRKDTRASKPEYMYERTNAKTVCAHRARRPRGPLHHQSPTI